MSLNYQAVGWNPQKKTYDKAIALGVVLYLAAFVGVGAALHPESRAETLIIRAFGTCAFLMLHVILVIGPLCRLDRRFLPLLYNRRHLGVSMFLVAFIHGGFSIVQFHLLGDLNPFVSLFVSNTRFDSIAQFPFQPLGFFALCILFLMAATSHDFWLANLSAPVWKALHMLVYVAYALLVMHVSLGILQSEQSPVWSYAVIVGAALVVGLHLASGMRERAVDEPLSEPVDDRFVDVCSVDEIPEGRALNFCLSGERVAVFKYEGKLSALSSVCQHQNGPLGEGRILDGCVTCPWHGYQYNPDTGSSPAPFTEKVPTFVVRVEGERVLVDPIPLPAGTPVEPARFGEGASTLEGEGA